MSRYRISSNLQNMETKRDYHRYAATYGLKKQWLNETFPYEGRSYTITGLAISDDMHPVVVTRDDGKSMRWSANVAILAAANID